MRAYKFERPRSHFCTIHTIKDRSKLRQYINKQHFLFITEILTRSIRAGWYLWIHLSPLTDDDDIRELEEAIDSWHNGIEYHSTKYMKKATAFIPKHLWAK